MASAIPMGMNSGAGALVWEVLRHVEAGRGVRGGFQTMQIGGRERTYLVHLPRLAPADATRVRRSTLGPCSRGSEVTLYSIEGGGHGWPGTSPRLRLLLGPVSRQIDTTQASWEFFERHPRR